MVLLVLVGCGNGNIKVTEGSADPAGGEACVPRDPLISSEDISRAGRDTPAAALLSWWQSLQFRDVATARRLYAEDVRTKGLATAIRELAVPLSRSRPIVRQSEVRGDRARLLVVIRASSGGCEDETVHEAPAAFHMVREGTWKQADNRYLEARLESLEEAERAAEG